MTLREAFEKGTAAFNDHDAAAFAERMADDVSARAPGMDVLHGRAAVSAFYQGWLEAFPDGHVEIEAAHFLDDAVVEEGYFVGTHRGTLRTGDGDIPATGRPVRAEYVQVVRYRGDQITSFHLLYDRAELTEQLGLAPGTHPEDAAWRAGEAAPPSLQTH
jgi:uncharacterized protein (TIGR02246 family)